MKKKTFHFFNNTLRVLFVKENNIEILISKLDFHNFI